MFATHFVQKQLLGVKAGYLDHHLFEDSWLGQLCKCCLVRRSCVKVSVKADRLIDCVYEHTHPKKLLHVLQSEDTGCCCCWLYVWHVSDKHSFKTALVADGLNQTCMRTVMCMHFCFIRLISSHCTYKVPRAYQIATHASKGFACCWLAA